MTKFCSFRYFPNLDLNVDSEFRKTNTEIILINVSDIVSAEPIGAAFPDNNYYNFTLIKLRNNKTIYIAEELKKIQSRLTSI